MPPPNSKPTSGFHRAIEEAEANGEFDFTLCCPVVFDMDQEGDDWPSWEPLPYKILKELKFACTEYGPVAPYTLSLIDTLAGKWMTPYDCTQVCKSCLSGGDYLLWRTEYDDRAKKNSSVKRNK